MGKTVVFMVISADLLHVGHVRALERAKALGDFLVVGVCTDEYLRSYKGEPVVPYAQRLEMVAALRCVDAIVPQQSFGDLSVLHEYDVQIRAVGPDYGVGVGSLREGQRRCLHEMQERGLRIVTIPRTPGVSTSLLRERCCEIESSVDSSVGCVGRRGCGTGRIDVRRSRVPAT